MSITEERFQTVETLEVKRADGTPIAKFQAEYFDVGYQDVLDAESDQLVTMNKRLDWAKAKLTGSQP